MEALLVMIEDFLDWASGLRQQNPPRISKKPVSRPFPRFVSIPLRPNSRSVKLDNSSLSAKRGWSQSGNSFRGYYRTKYGAWKGHIRRRGDKFDVFITNPPEEQMENHSRWICFHKAKGKDYKIDLSLNPKDKSVDSIIFYVERLIIESFEMP